MQEQRSVRVWFYWVIFLSLFIHLSAGAQSQEDERDAARQLADSAVQNAQSSNTTIDTSPLTELGDEYTNSIQLLQNRFRVDYNVKEITMVFFREYGSAPVVLVRPDGSKLFQGRVDEEKVQWYDADTFDMITIKDPVPGPWQAVGQVLPQSRVMVLSNVELHAEPLPNVLFAGEILKSTAYLTNNGKPIENKQFRDVVDLEIEFKSTNNPNYGNFGTNDQRIATFKDDGRGMDERPGDGVFTGQFNLKIPAGEWKPIFRVSTPMYTREQIGELIVLHENPVSIDVEMDATHELAMEEEFGQTLITNFPELTSPFWNMARNDDGNTAKKMDVILGGMETIGSAERSCDVDMMRDTFHSITDGEYSELLYKLFGKERVEAELEKFLEFDFFQRVGGGIGMTRMIAAMDMKEELAQAA